MSSRYVADYFQQQAREQQREKEWREIIQERRERAQALPQYNEGREAMQKHLEECLRFADRFTDERTKRLLAAGDPRGLEAQRNTVHDLAVEVSRNIDRGTTPAKVMQSYFQVPYATEESNAYVSGLRKGLMEWSHEHNHALKEQIQQIRPGAAMEQTTTEDRREIRTVRFLTHEGDMAVFQRLDYPSDAPRSTIVGTGFPTENSPDVFRLSRPMAESFYGPDYANRNLSEQQRYLAAVAPNWTTDRLTEKINQVRSEFGQLVEQTNTVSEVPLPVVSRMNHLMELDQRLTEVYSQRKEIQAIDEKPAVRFHM